MSGKLRIEKVIAALPSQLEPNTLYFVRSGPGIDIYLSDLTGSVAHKHNAAGGDGIVTTYWDIIAGENVLAAEFTTITGDVVVSEDTIIPGQSGSASTDRINLYDFNITFSLDESQPISGTYVYYISPTLCTNMDDLFSVISSNTEPYVVIIVVHMPTGTMLQIMSNSYEAAYSLPQTTNSINIRVDNGIVIINDDVTEGTSFGTLIIPNDLYYSGLLIESDFFGPSPNSLSIDLSNMSSTVLLINPPPMTNAICIPTANAVYNGYSYKKDNLYIVGDSVNDIKPVVQPYPQVRSNVFNVASYRDIYPTIYNATYTDGIVEIDNDDNQAILEYMNVANGSFEIDMASITRDNSYTRIYFTTKKLDINYDFSSNVDIDIFYIEIHRQNSTTLTININGDGYNIVGGTPINNSYVTELSKVEIYFSMATVNIFNSVYNLNGMDDINIYVVCNRTNMGLTYVTQCYALSVSPHLNAGDTVSTSLGGYYNGSYISGNTIGILDANMAYIPLNKSSNKSATRLKPDYKGVYTPVGSLLRSNYKSGDIVLYKDPITMQYSMRYINNHGTPIAFDGGNDTSKINYTFARGLNTTNNTILQDGATVTSVFNNIVKYGGLNVIDEVAYSVFTCDNTHFTSTEKISNALEFSFLKNAGIQHSIADSSVTPGFYTNIKLNSGYLLISHIEDLYKVKINTHIVCDNNFNNNDFLLIGIFESPNQTTANILSITASTITNNVGNTIVELSNFTGYAIFNSGHYQISKGLVSFRYNIANIYEVTNTVTSDNLIIKMNTVNDNSSYPVNYVNDNISSTSYCIYAVGNFTYNLKVGCSKNNIYVNKNNLISTTNKQYNIASITTENVFSAGTTIDYINRSNTLTSLFKSYTPLLHPSALYSNKNPILSVALRSIIGMFDNLLLYSTTSLDITHYKDHCNIITDYNSGNRATLYISNIISSYMDANFSDHTADPKGACMYGFNFNFTIPSTLIEGLLITVGQILIYVTNSGSYVRCTVTRNSISNAPIGELDIPISDGPTVDVSINFAPHFTGQYDYRSISVKMNNDIMPPVSYYDSTRIINSGSTFLIRLPLGATITIKKNNTYINHSYNKTYHLYKRVMQEHENYINSLTSITKQMSGLSAADNTIITASSILDNKFDMIFDLHFKNNTSNPLFLFGTDIRISSANTPFAGTVRIGIANNTQYFNIPGVLSDGFFKLTALKFTYIKLNNMSYYYRIEDIKTGQFLENVIFNALNLNIITGDHMIVNYAYYEYKPQSVISSSQSINNQIVQSRLVDLNTSLNTPIIGSDSLNTAIGKAQGQINVLKNSWVDYTDVFKPGTLNGISATGLIGESNIKLQFAKVNGMLWAKGCITTGSVDMDIDTAYAQLKDEFKVIAYKPGMTIQSQTSNSIQLDNDSTYKIGIYSNSILLLESQVSSVTQSFRLGAGTIPANKIITVYGCIGELINKG